VSVAELPNPDSASELVNVTGTPTSTTPFASLTVKPRVTAPFAGPVAAVEIADSVVATVSVGVVDAVTVETAFAAPNVIAAVSALVVPS